MDAAPLRGWLTERLVAEGALNAATLRPPEPRDRGPRSLEQIAQDWGTSARRMMNIVYGRTEEVPLELVDTILTSAGWPDALDDLYGLAA